MKKRPLTSRRQAVGLLLGSLAVSLATLEAGCRLLGIGQPRLYRPDTDRGWTLSANVRTHWSQEGSAPVRTNSQGYRDTEWDLASKEGVLRIAVLGDSFTEALQVPLEKTWVNQLPTAMAAVPDCRLLKGFPKGAETLNFGVGGYGTGQSWLTWRKDAKRYKPQIVLHAVYFENDLRDNILSDRGSGMGPSFRVLEGKLHQSNGFHDSSEYRFRTSWAGVVTGWILSWSRLGQLINKLKNVTNSRAGRECESTGCTFFPLGPDGTKLYGEKPGDLKQGWEVLRIILNTWKRQVNKTGSLLIVTSVTTPAQMWPKPRERQAEAMKHGLDWFRPETEMAEMLGKDDIPYLPLAEELQRQADTEGLVAHGFSKQRPGPGYGHWNQEGHSAAAVVLARKLCSIDKARLNG